MLYENECYICKAQNVWFIKLRGAEDNGYERPSESCNHIVCINCMLFYLEIWINKGKPRIKCPINHCRQRIHENDIRALLDPECSDLDFFMLKQIRKQLLFRHDHKIIQYAFGEENVRPCPRCRNLYAKKVGCNYVRCPNLYCNTWFCWHCSQKDVNYLHFSQMRCKLGWDDVLKGLYFLTFLLLADTITILFITPSIFLGLLIFLPILLTFATPAMIFDCVRGEWSLIEGKGFAHRAIFALSYILLFPIGIIIGTITLAISMFASGVYVFIVAIKIIPIVGQIMFIIEMLQYMTGCFGKGDWFQWYKKSREDKETAETLDRQFKKEQNERLANPLVGR